MKIKFWGTAAGLAEKNRYCTTVLIEIDDEYYILDFGAPVEYLIAQEGLAISKIKAGFITHMHSDHADSLVSFAKLYAEFTNFLYSNAKVEIYMPSGINSFCGWLDALNLNMSDRMKITEIKEGLFYNTDHLKVRAIRTKHLGEGKPSFAFIFEANDKKVLFTGDLTYDFSDFPVGEQYDLIVSELAHGGIEAVTSRISMTKCERVIFYHMTSDPYLLGKIGTDRIAELEENKDNLGFEYELAYDGYQTEI